MTKTIKQIAFELLGYPTDQSIAGMLASDLPKLRRIERSLLDIQKETREQTIRKCAAIFDCPSIKAKNAFERGENTMRVIGRDKILSLLKEKGE